MSPGPGYSAASTLGLPTPDAVLDVVLEGIVETGGSVMAGETDGDCCLHFGTTVIWEEVYRGGLAGIGV